MKSYRTRAGLPTPIAGTTHVRVRQVGKPKSSDDCESRSMSISILPVTADFVAEVGDIDLQQQLQPEDLSAIGRAFATYAVLVFPAQSLNVEQREQLRAVLLALKAKQVEAEAQPGAG